VTLEDLQDWTCGCGKLNHWYTSLCPKCEKAQPLPKKEEDTEESEDNVE